MVGPGKPRQQKFRAAVLAGHKGCAAEVPFDTVKVWGALPTEIAYQTVRGVPVRGTLDRTPFESLIVSRMGKSYLLVSAESLEAAGLKPGDTATFTVEPRGH